MAVFFICSRVTKNSSSWGVSGRRLVENQQRRAAIKRLEDFNPLLLSHGQLPDQRRIDFQTIEASSSLMRATFSRSVLHPRDDLFPRPHSPSP